MRCSPADRIWACDRRRARPLRRGCASEASVGLMILCRRCSNEERRMTRERGLGRRADCCDRHCLRAALSLTALRARRFRIDPRGCRAMDTELPSVTYAPGRSKCYPCTRFVPLAQAHFLAGKQRDPSGTHFPCGQVASIAPGPILLAGKHRRSPGDPFCLPANNLRSPRDPFCLPARRSCPPIDRSSLPASSSCPAWSLSALPARKTGPPGIWAACRQGKEGRRGDGVLAGKESGPIVHIQDA
jgi:hypothetical protein